MKIYIFQNLDKVSCHYHPEGGAIVIAEDEDHAINMIKDKEYLEVTEKEWDLAESYDISTTEPRIIIFPDAGCC